jgi:hypothetical protein
MTSLPVGDTKMTAAGKAELQRILGGNKGAVNCGLLTLE